jgi:hypothetical protein
MKEFTKAQKAKELRREQGGKPPDRPGGYWTQDANRMSKEALECGADWEWIPEGAPGKMRQEEADFRIAIVREMVREYELDMFGG